MKTLRNALLIGVALLAASLAVAADDDAVKKDMAALQGEWLLVSGTADGFTIPAEMVSRSKRTCRGDELTVIVGGDAVMRAKIKIDPSKTPKTIDYEVFDGTNKGKTQLGIYEVDGDTFKSCFAAPGAERPKEFASKSGERHTLTVWRRKGSATPPAEKK